MHISQGQFKKPTHELRKPQREDGSAIWQLICECKPLDENSMYCNLLQCDHFRDTCILAERDGAPEGWISAYIVPDDPETLFVWQVAVSEKARGTGLGITMLRELLTREECAGVTRMQTTITSDNAASWGLFRKLARTQGGALTSEPHFLKSQHFDDRHSTENMVTIALKETERKAA